MQKVVEVQGKKVHLRSAISPSHAIELQLLAGQELTLAMAAAIGITVAAGTGLKLPSIPAKSMYAYAREITDMLLKAGWSYQSVLQLGTHCLAHATDLVPPGAFPTEPEVTAALGPTSAPDEDLTDRG